MASNIRCPLCGGTTTIRTVKKGPDAGRSFYVCNRYPKCKGRTAIKPRPETAAPSKSEVWREQRIRSARDEIAKYRAEQEAIIREEEAALVRCRAEQEESLAGEKAKFEEYKAEQ